MSAEMRGLGRGLDALLGGSQPQKDEPVNPAEVKQLLISCITPNQFQPRIEFDQEALEDLSASIKAQGVLSPILVRPLDGGQYELVAGERRMRASKLAGLREIPALVREMSDDQSLAIALIENLQREDLNAIEEAKGYKQLMDQFGLSQEALASQVGKSRSGVANALRLLKLPEAVQQSISEGVITAGHGRALMALDDDQALGSLATRIQELRLSVRQAEAEAAYYNQNGTFPETGLAAPVQGGSGPVKKAMAVDENLIAIKESLEEAFGIKVSIAGSSIKGKISFGFGNAKELDTLIKQLGV